MTRPRFVLMLIASVTLIAAAGCGTSGSNPVLFAELRFEVTPTQAGSATFSVESLVANGSTFGFPDHTVFTTTAPFSFYLEGAAPAYSGAFARVGDAEITVRVFRERILVTEDSTDGAAKPIAAVSAVVGQGTPTVTPSAPMQLVRFDVCAPVVFNGACSTTGDAGLFGIPYSGTLGDPFTTHLLNGQTPSIYFLPGARDSANAVFRSASTQFLEAQLFVDNELRQTASGTTDVVLREDL